MLLTARPIDTGTPRGERIVAADNPDFKPSLTAQQAHYQLDRRN